MIRHKNVDSISSIHSKNHLIPPTSRSVAIKNQKERELLRYSTSTTPLGGATAAYGLRMFQLPQFIQQANRLDTSDFRNVASSNRTARSRSLASLPWRYCMTTAEVSLIIIKIHVFKVLGQEETQVCVIS